MKNLTPNGEAYLAYGCVAAIREIYRRAERHGLQVEKLDERELEDLEDLFFTRHVVEGYSTLSLDRCVFIDG